MTLYKINEQVSAFSNNQNEIMERQIKKKLDGYLREYHNALRYAEQSILNEGIHKLIKAL